MSENRQNTRLTRTELIDAAAAALNRMEPPQAGSFCGLKARVERLTELLIAALFPRHAAEMLPVSERLEEAAAVLHICLELCGAAEPERIVETLLAALPELRRVLETDLQAAYRGDPAARGYDEIILCYPAFPAIAAYRVAHVLYLEKVPLLPRMMTEYAHRQTGIDIHPGATIGESFFIDHGTGVVIGETTTIGREVKLYQHVTLGARSFELAPDGSLVKGIKRHPDIGDRVVIYAGATILGGETKIGNDCVIGGSVWLTHSVPAGKLVLARSTVMDAPLTRDIFMDPVLDSAML